MMQITRKRIKKIHASYTLEGTVLENVENIKYLGVTITNDLRWNTHVSNVCTKANRTLGFLRRNLYACPQEVKEAANKGLVRPVGNRSFRTQVISNPSHFVPFWSFRTHFYFQFGHFVPSLVISYPFRTQFGHFVLTFIIF